MRKISLVLILLMLLTNWSFCYAEQNSSNTTMMGIDGAYWNNMTKDDANNKLYKAMRLAILRGFYEGMWYTDVKFFNDNYYQDTSYDVICDALDQFYKDYKNAKVHIGDALQIIGMEMRGEDKGKIDNFTRAARQTGAEASKKLKDKK